MLRQEIDTLKDKMTAAIQAPIMIISDTVGKLINNSGVSNEVITHNRYSPLFSMNTKYNHKRKWIFF